jgi:hypothetical protein
MKSRTIWGLLSLAAGGGLWILSGLGERRPKLLSAGLAGLGAWLLLTGCAVSRPVITESVTTTNGVTTSRSLRVTQFALWPATQSVAKQRASLGKTFSFGSEGLELDGGSTNLTETIREATRLVQSLKQ